jgi:hypothetical protein
MMGIVTSAPTAFYIDLFGAKPTNCDLCGNAGAVYWTKEKTVVFCRECALHILPRLIADAVDLPRDKFAMDGAKRAWAIAEKEFWRSFASRLARQSVDNNPIVEGEKGGD